MIHHVWTWASFFYWFTHLYGLSCWDATPTIKIHFSCHFSVFCWHPFQITCFLILTFSLLLSRNLFYFKKGYLCLLPSHLHPCPLSLCPQCDCLANVLFQHPQQRSLRLQGLANWCKVNHKGGKEDGEGESKRKRPCASYHPLGHVVETLWGC